MSAAEAKAAAEQLPRLTDDQVARIAALLSLGRKRPAVVVEAQGGGKR